MHGSAEIPPAPAGHPDLDSGLDSGLDAGRRYRMHPSVALRPEPFGALAYHYGNRRLVFLRSPRLVEVVRSLDRWPSVGEALDAAGVQGPTRHRYLAALRQLAASAMLEPVSPPAEEVADAR